MRLRDVLYEKRNNAAWVTLDRPQSLNAITPDMIRSIRTAAEDAHDDMNVRALVITGSGRSPGRGGASARVRTFAS